MKRKQVRFFQPASIEQPQSYFSFELTFKSKLDAGENALIEEAAKILELLAQKLLAYVIHHEKAISPHSRVNTWVIPGLKTWTQVEQQVLAYSARALKVNVKLLFQAALEYKKYYHLLP